MQQRRNIKWVFLGSAVAEGREDANKVKDKMPPLDRQSHSSYLFRGKTAPFCQIDEYKMARVFEPAYASYQRLIYSPQWSTSKEDLVQALMVQFRGKQEGSLLVISGAAKPVTGEILLWSTTREGEEARESIAPAEVISLWKRRHEQQRHLLIIVDANYSEAWVKAAREAWDNSISVLASSRLGDKTAYDEKVGSYFLHNLYKILAGFRAESLVESQVAKSNPVFHGNPDEVQEVFGLNIAFQSVADMRAALSGYQNNQTRNLDFTLLDPRDFTKTTDSIHDVKCLPFMESRYGEPKTPRSKSPKARSGHQSPLRSPASPRFGGGIKSTSNTKTDYSDQWEGKTDSHGRKQGAGNLKNWKGETKFTGVFLNDLKNGIGVEYRPGGTRAFEGNFEGNKKNGRGRIFDRSERVTFEGKFENDQRHGPGTEYYESGEILFSGVYKNNVRDGLGTEFYKNGKKKLEGNWVGNRLNGEGKEFDDTGRLVFEGDFVNGLREGKGRLHFDEGRQVLEGTFEKGELAGEGKILDKNGNVIKQGPASKLNLGALDQDREKRTFANRSPHRSERSPAGKFGGQKDSQGLSWNLNDTQGSYLLKEESNKATKVLGAVHKAHGAPSKSRSPARYQDKPRPVLGVPIDPFHLKPEERREPVLVKAKLASEARVPSPVRAPLQVPVSAPIPLNKKPDSISSYNQRPKESVKSRTPEHVPKESLPKGADISVKELVAKLIKEAKSQDEQVQKNSDAQAKESVGRNKQGSTGPQNGKGMSDRSPSTGKRSIENGTVGSAKVTFGSDPMAPSPKPSLGQKISEAHKKLTTVGDLEEAVGAVDVEDPAAVPRLSQPKSK